jgi:hypothetical protein
VICFSECLGEDGEVNANHLLLGIWSDDESAGHKILYSLGFDDVKASLLAKTVRLSYSPCKRCILHIGSFRGFLRCSIYLLQADEEAAMSPR